MKLRPLTALAATLALAGATALSAGAPTQAAQADPTSTTLAKGLFSPLSVAVDEGGVRYFSQNFAGKLMRQVPGQAPEVVYKAPKGAEVGAVSVSGLEVTFAVSKGDNKKGTVFRMNALGDVTRLAKLHQAEKRTNPDGKTRYGFTDLSSSCAKQVTSVPKSYRGIKETHPYATTVVDGITYVADAGANNVWAVDGEGVSSLAVIPPAKAKVTQKIAQMFDLPSCVVGKKYRFESVPTDIEVGPDGWLYVSSLPGGPEDGSAGRNGSVFKVDPATGKTKKVVGGLLAATGLAVDTAGNLFVSELFSGRIVKIRAGKSKIRTFAQVPLPSDVEIGPDGVYALVNSLTGFEPGSKPRGKLVRLTP